MPCMWLITAKRKRAQPMNRIAAIPMMKAVPATPPRTPFRHGARAITQIPEAKSRKGESDAAGQHEQEEVIGEAHRAIYI